MNLAQLLEDSCLRSDSLPYSFQATRKYNLITSSMTDAHIFNYEEEIRLWTYPHISLNQSALEELPGTTALEGRSCWRPWTGAWQRVEPLHPAPPWERTSKDLQEIVSRDFLEFTFSGRNHWISRINHLWPLAANISTNSKPEPVRVVGKELGCRAREWGVIGSSLPVPAQSSPLSYLSVGQLWFTGFLMHQIHFGISGTSQ